MIREQRLLYLNPRDLRPSRRNVRSDPGDLAGLAETIREHGVLQPLGVAGEDGGYRVVYGNRRRDAAIVVGLDRVPCVEVGPLDDEEVLKRQVLENLQRLDLSDLDKAQAFEAILGRLLSEGVGQGEALDAMARTLGLSARQIQRYLRLNQLEPGVQRLIARRELGVTHAQHLVGLPAARQTVVAELVVGEGLSAAELSQLCAALARNANIDPQAALDALRRGERVPVVEERRREGLPHPGPTPAAQDRDDDDPWGDDEAGLEASGRHPHGEGRTDGRANDWAPEPATRDGNRVRRIHSLDAFMDELQRLTLCVQEGDFQRLMGDDEAAVLKVRLAVRQLRFLTDAVTALAQASEE